MGHDHPFGKAVWYAIVIFAVTHLALSLFYGIAHDDPDFANMFHVLSFDLIWPSLGTGALNAALGVIMIVAVWALMGVLLRYIHQHDTAKKHKKPAQKAEDAE